jgi:hypothetical protein
MKKATPIIILILFTVGVFFMVQGMKGAVEKTKPSFATQSNEG